MKKCICLLMVAVILFSLCACSKKDILNNTYNKNENLVAEQPDDEIIKAVWINYNELSTKSQQTDESGFEEKVSSMFRSAAEFGFNRVIVQVRPFSDAFYVSSFYPATEYLSGTQGVEVGFDALSVMVSVAKRFNLKIDAWINPYRVSYKTDFSLLADSNRAKIWYNEDNATRNLFVTDAGIFYNPASVEVQKLILDGVRELVNNYDIDGIHLDDYFYPTTDESIDAVDYYEYISSGGKMSLTQWRQENINSMMSNMYSIVKSVKPSALLTVSPSGDIEKNTNQYYADVGLWCTQKGYIDVIMPQLYYGFQNESKPFDTVARQWSELADKNCVRLCFGLAIYKSGKEDTYAGAGKDEWLNNTDIILRQMSLIKTLGNYGGFAFYSYSQALSANNTENAKKELQNVKDML